MLHETSLLQIMEDEDDDFWRENSKVCMGMSLDFGLISNMTMLERSHLASYPETVRYTHCCLLTLPQQVINNAPCVSRLH